MIKFVIVLKSGLLFNTFYLVHFLFVNKTYSQITKEPYGFKMQLFKVLLSEEREPNKKILCLYDLTSETKTTLHVSVGNMFPWG